MVTAASRAAFRPCRQGSQGHQGALPAWCLPSSRAGERPRSTPPTPSPAAARPAPRRRTRRTHPLECRRALPQLGRLPGPAGIDARTQRLPQQRARHFGIIQRQLGQPLAGAVLQGAAMAGTAGALVCRHRGAGRVLAAGQLGGGAGQERGRAPGWSCRLEWGTAPGWALLRARAPCRLGPHLDRHEAPRRAALHHRVDGHRPPRPAPAGGVHDVFCRQRRGGGVVNAWRPALRHSVPGQTGPLHLSMHACQRPQLRCPLLAP